MIAFDDAVYVTEGTREYLKLRLLGQDSRREARKFAEEKHGKPCTAEFRARRGKRSTDANSKAWALISKLAEALNLPPDEIYRGYVKDIGKFDQYLMKEDAFRDFSEAWEAGHIGRFALLLGGSREKPGYVWAAVYLGSSDYDTKDMSRMLDMIIQDCRAQGIETMSPSELEGLLGRWDEAGGHKQHRRKELK